MKSEKTTEPFSDFEFVTEYPSSRVADHEVFMSFTNDDDAIAFREWLASVGLELFDEYLENKS